MQPRFRVTYRCASRRVAIDIHDADCAIQAALWAADRIAQTLFIDRNSLHLVKVQVRGEDIDFPNWEK